MGADKVNFTYDWCGIKFRMVFKVKAGIEPHWLDVEFDDNYGTMEDGKLFLVQHLKTEVIEEIRKFAFTWAMLQRIIVPSVLKGDSNE